MTQYILSVNRAVLSDDRWYEVFRGDADKALDESRFYLLNGYDVHMEADDEEEDGE